ncbi:NUDIX hydrolase [Antribacter sp. KLBMP9083]|uniref:NUDIX hydrolase n=1 Tax=Antribacter soli TaxID=2910976 RepID=A0AA41U6F5_9MICO|nr:NUDIX hydrolase [Antribacter soli]
MLHSDDGRVVLVEPTYKPGWEIPGGVVEADEAPWAAAAREVREELGLELTVGRPLVIDHLTAQATAESMLPSLLAAGHITPQEAADATAALTAGLCWIFEGGQVTDGDLARFTLDDTELRSARLCPPDEVHRLAKPSLARRVACALDAQRTGTGPLLCENGVTV